ncbi:MAG: ribonuclease H family protein [Prevotella sp.]
MGNYHIYTDGSYLNNGNNGTGGYCAIVQDLESDVSIIAKGSQANTTNIRMEMLAIIKGIAKVPEASTIKLYSDCQMLVNSINTWLDGWIVKNFKGVANVDLWELYLKVAKPHEIKAVWVKAHNGNKLNERCDAIASDEARKLFSRIKNG